MRAAVDDELRALGHACLDVRRDAVAMLGPDQRTDLHALLVTRTDDHPGGRIAQRLQHAVRGPAHRDGNRSREAPLAGVAERRVQDRRDRQLQVGVRHDDHVVLCAAQRLHALAMGRGFRVDVLGHRRRAHERDRRDGGMAEQRVDRGPGAVDYVQDAGRETRVEEQLSKARTSQRGSLRGLQDEGVACHYGERKHPERDHHREVERGDAGANADRVAVEVLVDAAGDVAQRAALQQGRRAAREIDHLDPAPDLPAGLLQCLPVMARHDRGELLEVVLEHGLVPEHQPDPFHDRCAGPRSEGFDGGADPVVDLDRVRQRDVFDDLACGRVVDGQGARILLRQAPL